MKVEKSRSSVSVETTYAEVTLMQEVLKLAKRKAMTALVEIPVGELRNREIGRSMLTEINDAQTAIKRARSLLDAEAAAA